MSSDVVSQFMKSKKRRTSHINAPLDKLFRPAALVNQEYLDIVTRAGKIAPLVIGVEREDGRLSRYETTVLDEPDDQTLYHVERLVKFLLWAWGGWKIYVGGPRTIGEHIRNCYCTGGARAFDVELMSRAYERPFEVAVMEVDDVPAEREGASSKGGHLDGCRIGFDLGASDYKVAAVKDGTAVFSAEFAWNPKEQADPEYHFAKLNDGITKAARYLPRVDAIGGSTAGVAAPGASSSTIRRAASSGTARTAGSLSSRRPTARGWTGGLVAMRRVKLRMPSLRS